MQIEVANKECLPVLDRCSFYRDQHQLKYRLKLLNDIDLIHCHNEPNWTVEVAKDARPDLPLVFDIHDLESARTAPVEDLLEYERTAIRLADAYIFPSQGYQAHARKCHNIPDSKPSEVVYSYCNNELLNLEPRPRIRGVVYEGNVSHTSDMRIAYSDQSYVSEYLKTHNIPFALYGIEDERLMKIYMDFGAMCFPVLPYGSLIENLSRYDWGYLGHPEPCRKWLDAMPNKLFEYIMAGIPVICCNAPEAGAFVEQHGLGVSIYSIHEIPEIYEQHTELRKNVQQKRHEFIMESQVETILDLYRKVLNV